MNVVMSCSVIKYNRERFKKGINIMKFLSKIIKSINIFLLCISVVVSGLMHGAATSTPTAASAGVGTGMEHTMFIILSSNEQIRTLLNNFVTTWGNALRDALGLSRGFNELVLLGNATDMASWIANGLRQKSSLVILAEGDSVPNMMSALADVRNNVPEKSIDSIILFDPTVTGKDWLHPLGNPITIPYNKIRNRIYNFYGEATTGFTRKIMSHYDLAQNRLQGINIKCTRQQLEGAKTDLSFRDLFIRSDIDPNTYLQKIVPAIKLINDNYKISNDLLCMLFSRHTKEENAKCPIVTINPDKGPRIEKQILQTNVYTNFYSEASSSLSDEQIEWISTIQRREQLNSEMIYIREPLLAPKRKGLLARTLEPAFMTTWNAQVEIYAKKVEETQPASEITLEQISVRRGLNNECPEEQSYLRERMQKVKEHLTNNLNIPIRNPPKIALIASGGGVRAMLETLGVLNGLDNAQLMDSITYLCGLSGSTWAIGTLLASQRPIGEFTTSMLTQLTTTTPPNELVNNATLLGKISAPYYWKSENHLPYTLVDIYGGYLQESLFSDDKQFNYLSEQKETIKRMHWPMPIYSAVRADGTDTGQTSGGIDPKLEKQWYEFTPYEVGASWLLKDSPKPGVYIPSEYFGSEFNNGLCEKISFEQPFALHMAIFGSAFALDVERACVEAYNKLGLIGQIVGTATPYLADTRRQITAAQYNNFTRDMAESKLGGQDTMGMADAGLAFNLPFPPVSGENGGRKADIMIFVDASADKHHPGNEMIMVEKYARQKNLKFPSLARHEINLASMNYEAPYEASYEAPQEFTNNITKDIRVFMHKEDPECPLVIYIRLPIDPATIQILENDASTFKFNYAIDISGALMNRMKSLIMRKVEKIKQAILLWNSCQPPEEIEEIPFTPTEATLPSKLLPQAQITAQQMLLKQQLEKLTILHQINTSPLVVMLRQNKALQRYDHDHLDYSRFFGQLTNDELIKLKNIIADEGQIQKLLRHLEHEVIQLTPQSAARPPDKAMQNEFLNVVRSVLSKF